MTDKYFFKLLLSIWCCLIIILLFISIALRQIDTPLWITAQQNLLLNTYSESAQITYALHGIDGLKKWVNELSRHENTHLLLMDEKNRKVFNIQQSKRVDINGLVDSGLSDAKPHKFNHYVLGSYIVKTPHLALRLVANKKVLNGKQIPYIPNLGVRIIVALIVAFIFCYLIVAGIYLKLRQVRKAVNRISKGNFADNIDLKSNSSEISMLLNDVNSMSQNIADLIEAKNRLLQDISHEFRSPLARQLMAIEIVKRQLNAEQLQHFDRIKSENINLESLVSELLEYSKANKEMELLIEPINVKDLLSKVIANVSFEFQIDCISLSCKAKISYSGDVGLLYRAFENLLRNAIQYAGCEKAVNIIVGSEDNTLIIRFNDRGPGVAENDCFLMFQPFYRINKNHKKKGYGLGLAIAQKIIDRHKGKIYADNRKGGGLSITIELPA